MVLPHIYSTDCPGQCLRKIRSVTQTQVRPPEPQALHGLAPKCKLINMHELINKSTNDYVTLLPCENGVNVNNKG